MASKRSQIKRSPTPSVKPRRRTHKERREATHNQLINAAIECVNELGYSGATLSIISDRAGVTRGAVQHHFGARNDLFLVLVAEISDQLFAQSDKKSLSGKSLGERLAYLTEQYWHIINSPHYLAAAQIMLGTAHDPKLYAQVFKVMRKAETRLDSRWIELFPDVPADRIMAARHLVLATFRGLTIRQLHRKIGGEWDAERRLLLDMLERSLGR
jgi:AcrR family transcriptional regulator